MNDILVQPFFSKKEVALTIRNLFNMRGVWDNRGATKVPYRNGSWYTVGSSLYLDLLSESQLPAYLAKVQYFNQIMRQSFAQDLFSIRASIKRLYFPGQEVEHLADYYKGAGYPGFSIMPPEETFAAEFAVFHKDERWKTFTHMGDFPFKGFENHFSFTIPLALPIQGGGMNLVHEELGVQPYYYDVGFCYLHSGAFLHQVMSFPSPVTPLDWRITIQGHGFTYKNTVYLYW